MRRNVVVVGASAGGVEALRTLVAGLPANLPATVLIVLHVPSFGVSALPAILDRSGPLPVRQPRSGDRLDESVIFVAPPDHHLVVHDDHVSLTRGPRENGHRPAIDVLFRSAARARGAHVIGVVLSGTLDDGSAGLHAVAARGGVTVVQNPTDALYPAMPLNAMSAVEVDHVVNVSDIGRVLTRLCSAEVPDVETTLPPLMAVETDLALMDGEAMIGPDRPGTPSGFSCPDCNGVLWEIEDGDLTRYRCRVGHAWSSESLFGEQTTRLDDALWMALLGLEEKAALAVTLAERALERGDSRTADRSADQAGDAGRAASTIRVLLENHLGIEDNPASA